MTLPVKVNDEAVADVSGAASWYGERSLKVADAFIDEVYATTSSSGNSPTVLRAFVADRANSLSPDSRS